MKTYSRATTCETDLSDVPGVASVRIHRPFMQNAFRPTKIVEKVNQRSNGDDGYTVQVFGPVVTPSGKDHATQYGDRTYGSWRDTTVEDLPGELKPYLVGREALVGYVFEEK